MSFVSVQHLQKSYAGTPVFSDINCEIAKGEFVTLLGPSGCGKSTLLRCIAGLTAVDSGQILLDGQDIVPLSPQKRHIGMVFQSYALFPHLSVRENLELGLRMRGSHGAARDQRIKTILEVLQLSQQAHQRPSQLSGGQRQRIALARAIIKDAPILVLDEATSALDSEVEASIQTALNRVMDGKTVLAIAHRLSTLTKMDRIIVMDAGRIFEEGSHEDLLARNGLYAKYWQRQSGGFIRTEAAE